MLIGFLVMGLAYRAGAHSEEYCVTQWAAWAEKADNSLSPGLFLEAVELRSQCRKVVGEQVRTTPIHEAGGERWRALVSIYWPADLVDRAMCVLWHESRGREWIDNPRSGAAGLFQIMPFWWEKGLPSEYRGDRHDPVTNVRAAYYIYTRQGWRAWTVLPLC